MLNTYQKPIFKDTNAEVVQATLPQLDAGEMLIRAHYSLVGPGTEGAGLWDEAEFRLTGEVVETGPEVTEGGKI